MLLSGLIASECCAKWPLSITSMGVSRKPRWEWPASSIWPELSHSGCCHSTYCIICKSSSNSRKMQNLLVGFVAKTILEIKTATKKRSSRLCKHECTHIIHGQSKCAPGQNFPLVDPCSEKLKWERASYLWNDAIFIFSEPFSALQIRPAAI